MSTVDVSGTDRQLPARRAASLEGKLLLIGLGAQKAGSSWLADYLRSHPQAYVPALKELHYFDVVHMHRLVPGVSGRMERIVKRMAGRADTPGVIAGKHHRDRFEALLDRLRMTADGDYNYIDFFADRVRDESVFCDITPSYSMLDADAFQAMLGVHSNVRFLFVMRDPVDRLWSAIRMGAAKRGVDPHREFSRNLAMEEHVRRTDYARTICELESAVPPNRIKYIFYEHLFTARSMEDLTSFIGIDLRPAEFNKVVNGGNELALTPELHALGLARFRHVYDYVFERFGAATPDRWRASAGEVGSARSKAAEGARRPAVHKAPKAIFILGVGKSGTTGLFYAIRSALNRQPGLAVEGLFEPTRPKEVSEYLGAGRDGVGLVKMLLPKMLRREVNLPIERFDKRIFIYRDPRDNVVSRLLFMLPQLIPAFDEQALGAILRVLRRKESDPSSLSVTEIIKVIASIARRDDLLEDIRTRAILPAHIMQRQSHGYFLMPYDDLVEGRLARLSDYLGVPMTSEFETTQKHAYVVRRKTSGDWRNWFLEEDVRYFAQEVADAYRVMGFDPAERPEAERHIPAAVCSEYVLSLFTRMQEKRVRQRATKRARLAGT